MNKLHCPTHNRVQLSKFSWTRCLSTFQPNGEPSLSHYTPVLRNICQRDDQALFIWRDTFRDIKEYEVLSMVQRLYRSNQWKHISAAVPMEKAFPYRSGRKNERTQDIMVVCSFDMRFTWMWPGWEGSTHNFRILIEATMRQYTNFPRPPQHVRSSTFTSVTIQPVQIHHWVNWSFCVNR